MKKLLYVKFIKPPRKSPYYYVRSQCKPLVSYVGKTFIVTDQPIMKQLYSQKNHCCFAINLADETKRLFRDVVLEYDPATFIPTYKEQISPYAYWYRQQFGDK